MHAIYYYPPPVKTQRFRPLTAFLALCVSLVLVQSTLSNTIARTRPELPGCVMLAAIPHRRLPGESPVRAVGVAEAVCPNTVTTAGFTLIELSIVLVIIGLIVGGVLVGQDLIRAAAVRAQIAQIEKYNTAVNTFRGKYAYLPGDIPDPDASRFNFQPRGTNPGQGDGNGVITGYYGGSGGSSSGFQIGIGENGLFWRDLSDAHLIDNGFSLVTAADFPLANIFTPTSTPPLNALIPEAKIGNGNYVYVWSGGAGGVQNTPNLLDGKNYFGLSAATSLGAQGAFGSNVGLTVAQAYAIDKKMDDGIPQTGRVQAWYIGIYNALYEVAWAAGATGFASGGAFDSTTLSAVNPSSTGIFDGSPPIAQKCYDNGGTKNVEQYNLAYPNNVNCAVSFQFQ